MNFNIINKDDWNRKEYFDHYFSEIPCTYSMTVKLDITKIKNSNRKLYPTMLYFITKVVNRHSEFRTTFDMNGNLGIFDQMLPWATFEGFNLNLQKGYGYLLPIFTMGRYYEESGRYILPLAIQVHHAVCDGFHVSRFVNELQELIES